MKFDLTKKEIAFIQEAMYYAKLRYEELDHSKIYPSYEYAYKRRREIFECEDSIKRKFMEAKE